MSATSVSPAGLGPSAVAPSAVRPRLESVDLLRGLVMVLMVLDHTRDFLGDISTNPTDLATTTPALFFTRWVTHFCAPVFAFLAGTGAYLAGSMRGLSRPALGRFLVTRGLWLIVLEVTLVRLGLTFQLVPRFMPMLVCWSIGVSMIVLGGLVPILPSRAIGGLGLLLIAGHNLFDGVRAAALGPFGPLWTILHQPGAIEPVKGVQVFFLYSLIPWVGVVMAGYAFGEVFRLEPQRRRRLLLAVGLGTTVAFLVLRAANVYGNPVPWTFQERPGWTVLSFLNCQKYPPSLLYLLMTLGPAILLLAAFERGIGPVGRPLVTLGRVPLFFYLLQWPLLHATAIVVARLTGQPFAWLLHAGPFDAPVGYGHGLPFVYGMWLAMLAALYPACAWFAALKRRRRDAWLSYL